MKLAELVDAYLDKHEACVAAGHAWERAKKAAGCDCSKHVTSLMTTFMTAHNARARAFTALKDARAQKRRRARRRRRAA